MKGKAEQSRAQVGSGYLKPGLVSVSVVLVLGVLTLDYRIPELSRKRKRVNPGNSDAGYGVLLHHEFGKWKSKRRKHRCTRSVPGNRLAGEKGKAGARMCVVCRGNRTHKEERKKGNFCTCDRFSADGFRTRATRVIRWRVLGVRAAKGETERRGTGRPGDSRTPGKRCVCV